jgi:putative ABC transport system permease protein
MARPLGSQFYQRDRRFFASTATLAWWRLRTTWGLLLLICLGMVLAVMLVCAAPLSAQIAVEVGLQATLNRSPQDLDITVTSSANEVSASFLKKASGEIDSAFRKQLSPYIGISQSFIQSDVYFLTHQGHETNNQLHFVATSMIAAASHLRMIQGKLPAPTIGDQSLEIALPLESAQKLHAQIGSVLTIEIAFIEIPLKRVVINLPLRIVGLFGVQTTKKDPFWNQVNLLSTPRGSALPGTISTALVSEDAFLATLMRLSSEPQLQGLVPEESFSYIWYYHLDANKVSVGNLDAVIVGITNVPIDIANIPDLNSSSNGQQTQTIISSEALTQYRDRLMIVQVAVVSLLLLILGLILFFVSMMTDLLVERQAASIALLRSRGANFRQIFGALLIQSFGLGVIALITGPLLALLCVSVISHDLFVDFAPSATSGLSDNPLQALWQVRWYALTTVLASIATMALAIFRASSRDVLVMRREVARSTSRPLWQRLHLDMIAALVMLTVFGISFYLVSSGLLDPQLRIILLAPLALLQSVSLVLASVLFFLRFFPFLLQVGSRLLGRNRGAAPLLAVAQMARAPQQSIRMTLLLALATAFAIFTLVFTASQTQRASDVASYDSGADFSGILVHPLSPSPFADIAAHQAANLAENYQHIPGVVSVSMGYSGQTAAGLATGALTIQLQVVDADTFAQTADWTAQDSSQSISSLMSLLASLRQSTGIKEPIPVIVDAATWNALDLGSETTFQISTSYGYLTVVAVAEVQHIPTITDEAQSNDSNATGGMLVDYQTFSNVYTNVFYNKAPDHPPTLPINYVFLRTKSDTASLSSVRNALRSGNLALNPLYDRREIMSALLNDPLYLDVIIILAFGAATALLLALIGNLIASWLSVYSRLLNFSLLRALGMPPFSLAEVLTWEQGIIYMIGMALGILFGAVLSAWVVPTLVFTGIAGNSPISDIAGNALYLAQAVPPIRIVIPMSLSIALAVLMCICLITLGIMIRVISRPSLDQTLRLNQD